MEDTLGYEALFSAEEWDALMSGGEALQDSVQEVRYLAGNDSYLKNEWWGLV